MGQIKDEGCELGSYKYTSDAKLVSQSKPPIQ